MDTKIVLPFLISSLIALDSGLLGMSEAHAMKIVASGAEGYSRPRVNNNDEIVWSQSSLSEGVIATVWSNKRGQISFNSFGQPDWEPDINDVGEIIWRFGDGGQGPDGIESNVRGLVYYEEGGAIDPYYDSQRINNNGEIIWTKSLWPTGYRAEEIWSSERGRLTYSPEYAINREPAINDNGEVVYKSYLGPTGNTYDILSTEQGERTNDPLWQWQPDVNQSGEVVWSQLSPEGGTLPNEWEIWSNQRGQITDNSVTDQFASINDEGEIVWQTWDGNDYEIISNIRGQITDNDVYDTRPHINNRGTIVWLSNDGKTVMALYATSEITVIIDIKPRSKQNVINPRAKGDVWVAILSVTDPDAPFDPSSQVDIPTVEFGPDGANATRHKVKDINKDGLGDLLLRFNIPETGIACGDTEATLTGETFDVQSFTGADSIKTVGCKPKKCHKNKHHKKHNDDDDHDNDKNHNGKHKEKKDHDRDRDDDHKNATESS